MSLKSINAKNFVKDTGTKKQLFVFVGSDNSTVASESTKTDLDVWKKSDFSVRVGQSSVYPIVPNIKWIQKRAYVPWSSVSQNSGAFYVYNEQNQYVYLCISDNELNRKDLQGQNVSNIRPTHTVGSIRYSDGYAWKPLYRITPSLERFITSQWIPVVSFDLFDAETQQTQSELVQEFCDSSVGTTGQCAIYTKKAISTDDVASTIEYAAGDLFTIATAISCRDCYYLTKNNDTFTSVFYLNSETVPTTTTIVDEYTKIGQLISTNQISTASPYYYLYSTNTNDNVEEGSIISAFIDLSNFTQKELLVNRENPELTLSSNTGTGARIRLKTQVLNDNIFINGIEVIESGSGYTDILAGIDSTILSGTDAETLISAITINLDVVDGLAFDPVEVLNAQHVMVDARLEKKSIEDAGILLPENLNFFSLVENPKGISGSTEVISGSNLNKKLDYIFRTTTKVKTRDAVVPSIPEEDLILDESYVSLSSTNPNVKTSKVLITGNIQEGLTYTSELKGLNYTEASSLVSSYLISADETIQQEIKEVVENAKFVQYTGKVLSTTKLNNTLPISDVDSVIIRINMVKGM